MRLLVTSPIGLSSPLDARFLVQDVYWFEVGNRLPDI